MLGVQISGKSYLILIFTVFMNISPKILSFLSPKLSFRRNVLTASLSLSSCSSASASSSSCSSSSLNDYNYAWDYYNNVLGGPKYIMAPMVDQSELAFRLLVKNNGCDICFSQMHHAFNFNRDPKYREDSIDWEVDSKHYDIINQDIDLSFMSNSNNNDYEKLDQKLIVQFAGNDPNILVEAASHVQHQKNVAGIDLNLGCPQKIAKRGNYGAYLLQNQQSLILDILSNMVNKLDVPVSAKIRILGNDDDTIKFCKQLQNTGISMLTVHGRTVDNSKLFTGPANWDVIKDIKQELDIPIVANGGISCLEDANKCLEYTGVEAIMSSEALLENPKLFNYDGDASFRKNYITTQLQTVSEYLRLVEAFRSPSPFYQVVRSHLFRLLFRFVDAPKNKDLRQILAKGRLPEMYEVINTIYERMQTVDMDVECAIEAGLLSKTSWYMRHRCESNSERRMANKRKYIYPPTQRVGNIVLNDEEVKNKVIALKDRLKKKRQNNIM